MEITEEQLQRFIALYKQEFGITLSPVDAQQSFLSLLRLMGLSVPPLEKIPENDINEMLDSSK